MPYDQLLPRLQRFAVREFSKLPGLPLTSFERRLTESFFRNNASPQAVTDLLELQRIWNFESDWYWSSPLLDPGFFKQRAKRLNWPAEKLAVYQHHFERLREIAGRYKSSENPVEMEMARLAQEVIKAWGNDRPVSPLSIPDQ